MELMNSYVKDINGKELFENDIIRYVQHLFNSSYVKIKHKQVKYNKSIGKWNIYESNAGESDVEYIGIDPQLLEIDPYEYHSLNKEELIKKYDLHGELHLDKVYEGKFIWSSNPKETHINNHWNGKSEYISEDTKFYNIGINIGWGFRFDLDTSDLTKIKLL